ncbi:MAG TPA: HlyD family efflux transporter periplasmic adaptor subunit [Holophagaceae bacterium]|nr:HlyD family efflux transporter periplasmic adaptor subunit [Holophagaceae bacterium]
MFWTLAAGVVAGLIFSTLAKVEVNTQGRGVLQAQGGVRTLFAQVDGSVSKLMAYSGAQVNAGDAILRLESAPTLAALFQSDRQLQQQRSGAKGFNQQQDALYDQQVAKLKARIALLSSEVASYGQTIVLYREKVAATEELLRQGIVSKMSVGDAKEALQQAQRQQDGSRQSLAQTQQELASLQGQHEGQLLLRAESMNEAVTKREALDYALRQGDVLAPAAGCLEAVLVKPGDAVRAGQVLGRLVPQGTALQVVSFLPEKDRAFIHAGDVAQVEVDQLPYAEYGVLKARVKRVAEDFASPDEISDALAGGKLEGSFVRVELEAMPDPGRRMPLRPGMLLSVRYTLRRQRLITVIFDPLRRVFHG